MCIVCVEWNKVSPKEVARGVFELSDKHFDEVLDKIEKEDKETYDKVVDELLDLVSYASKST
jgi:hypothetical protein